MKKIVIHRDRTFEVDGETFQVDGTYANNPENPGWGYTIYHPRTGTEVGSGYHDLSEVRADARQDIVAWKASHALGSDAKTNTFQCSCGLSEGPFGSLDELLNAVEAHLEKTQSGPWREA